MLYRPKNLGLWDTTLFRAKGCYHLFTLTGNAWLGHAVSDDLAHWERRPEIEIDPAAGGWKTDHFLTGDVGYMAPDGYFYIVDRKKDMIISGGFNVYPQMIEQAIYEHPAVAECIVLGIPDEYRGEAAKAFVTLKPGAEAFTLEELVSFLEDRLGRHELPAALEFRDELPKTSVGKLSRKELRDMEKSRTATPTHTEHSRS